jgi:hypothetical protein
MATALGGKVVPHRPRTDGDYPRVGSIRTRQVYVHRRRAELALGKPLPKGAVIHHVDGTTSPTSPLVICQDAQYHMDLHVRLRVLRSGGNPWTDKLCSACRQPKPYTAFYSTQRNGRPALSALCRVCSPIVFRRWYLARKDEECITWS